MGAIGVVLFYAAIYLAVCVGVGKVLKWRSKPQKK